jgi:hypothetical protein
VVQRERGTGLSTQPGCMGGEWNLLTTCENKGATPGVVKACDRLNTSGEQRFYRVVEVR